jgi:hypothetical protein
MAGRDRRSKAIRDKTTCLATFVGHGGRGQESFSYSEMAEAWR